MVMLVEWLCQGSQLSGPGPSWSSCFNLPYFVSYLFLTFSAQWGHSDSSGAGIYAHHVWKWREPQNQNQGYAFTMLAETMMSAKWTVCLLGRRKGFDCA